MLRGKSFYGGFLSGGKNRCINIIPRKGDNSCWLCVVKNNPLSLSSSFLLAFFHRSLKKKKKKKSTIVKSVERISFVAAIPFPDLSRRYSRESSALFDVCGRSGGRRDREEPRDNHVTKETTSVSCQTKLLLLAGLLAWQTSPEDRSKVRRPQETGEWFLRLRCNIGFCALPPTIPRRPEIKGKLRFEKISIPVSFSTTSKLRNK